jgi:hypothetical protein
LIFLEFQESVNVQANLKVNYNTDKELFFKPVYNAKDNTFAMDLVFYHQTAGVKNVDLNVKSTVIEKIVCDFGLVLKFVVFLEVKRRHVQN